MNITDCYIDETLGFALQFHDYTFRDDAADFIPTYMDPATGDATNLAYVDLSCTLGQITWADFGGVKLTDPVVSFKEINPFQRLVEDEFHAAVQVTAFFSGVIELEGLALADGIDAVFL